MVAELENVQEEGKCNVIGWCGAVKERLFIFVGISDVLVSDYFFAFVLISTQDKRQIFMYIEFNRSLLRTFGLSQSPI
jgi:hypothetical protein